MPNAAYWTERLHDLASQSGVRGAVLGIWADGQEVVACHGVLNSGTSVETTPGSLFQVGSITKVWTATMIMQLIDEGSLSLDTTVAQALPGAPICTSDVSGEVTIEHLLTHTSGIPGLDIPEPDEMTLLPADSTGDHFVLKLPGTAYWTPVSFGRLRDQTPYVYLFGRVLPQAAVPISST